MYKYFLSAHKTRLRFSDVKVLLMTPEQAQLLAPTLFVILLTIVFINTLIYLGYFLRDTKGQLPRRLFLYWTIQLIALLTAPLFLEGNLMMGVTFSGGIFNLYFLYQAMFADQAKVLPYKVFLIIYFLVAWPLTIILEQIYGDFTITSMPISVGLALPLLYMLKLVIFDPQKRFRSPPYIVMSITFFGGAVHAINYALFRDDPGSIIWGTTVHILLITIIGIGMANFYNYILHKSENIRLGILVDEKTAEINQRLAQVQALKERNEGLFKVVLHDISNPMSAILGYLTLLKSMKVNLSGEQKQKYIDRAMVASESVASTIRQVRLLASDDGGGANYNDQICLKEAFNLAQTIFEPLYQKKGIRLSIEPPKEEICIKGNKELFIHTVLGNLLSNSLKFTESGKSVSLDHEVREGKVIVCVSDQGHGIQEKQIKNMFQFESSKSTTGTHGELGNGFGMPLLKKYVEQNQGAVEVESTTISECDKSHGTSIRVIFPLNS